jgi:hypothetical protein
MASCAPAHSTLGLTDGRAVFAVGVFHGDLAVPESEHITAIDLDPSAVRPRSSEYPFGYPSVPAHKMARVTPMRIGVRGPNF